MPLANQWSTDAKDKDGVGQEVYSGAASFGLFLAKIGVVVGTIIGVLLVGFGIRFWTGPDPYSAVAKAEVIDAQCGPADKSQSVQCWLKLKYTVAGKTYETQLSRSDRFYARGYLLDIRYRPENPSDVHHGMARTTSGKWMVGIGIVLVLAAWVNWWIKQRYKFAAAAGGVGAAYDMVF